MELKKWNEEAKEKILNFNKLEELEVFFDEMYNKYFLNYNVKVRDFKEKILKDENFRKLSLEKQKKMFISMLDLNQMYVNMSERKDKKFGISEEDM
jgi:adenine-specific DNA-methyltransferase